MSGTIEALASVVSALATEAAADELSAADDGLPAPVRCPHTG